VVSTTPRPLYPQERPGTHWTGGWVGPRAGLKLCDKSRPTWIRSPDRPARSQSLYRMSSPGPIFYVLLYIMYYILHVTHYIVYFIAFVAFQNSTAEKIQFFFPARGLAEILNSITSADLAPRSSLSTLVFPV
jgi:hypothetical protein